jgi:hypothetical protein
MFRILTLIASVIPLLDRMVIHLKKCPCGKTNIKTQRMESGNWIAYCADPRGCKHKTAEYRLRRHAKIAWNRWVERR